MARKLQYDHGMPREQALAEVLRNERDDAVFRYNSIVQQVKEKGGDVEFITAEQVEQEVASAKANRGSPTNDNDAVNLDNDSGDSMHRHRGGNSRKAKSRPSALRSLVKRTQMAAALAARAAWLRSTGVKLSDTRLPNPGEIIADDPSHMAAMVTFFLDSPLLDIARKGVGIRVIRGEGLGKYYGLGNFEGVHNSDGYIVIRFDDEVVDADSYEVFTDLLAHELGHEIDYATGGNDYGKLPALKVNSGKDGDSYAEGWLSDRIVALYIHGSEEMRAHFAYPLEYGSFWEGTANKRARGDRNRTVSAELFAQVVAVYYARPGLMAELQTLDPELATVLERFFDALQATQRGRRNSSGFRQTAERDKPGRAGPDKQREVESPVQSFRRTNPRGTGSPNGQGGQSAGPQQGQVTTPAGWFEQFGRNLDLLTSDPKQWFTEHVLGWMTLEQISDRTKSAAVKAYVSVMHSMQRMSKEHVQAAAEIDKRWAELQRRDPKQNEQLNDVMILSTLAAFDPAGGQPAVTKEEIEVSNAWNRLDKDFKAHYVKVRNFYKAEMDTKKAILTDLLKNSKNTTQKTKLIEGMFNNVKGPYFPLMRMGEYYTVAMSKELQALTEKEDKAELTKSEALRLKQLRKSKDHYLVEGHRSLRAARIAAEAHEKNGMVAYFNKSNEANKRDLKNLPDLPLVEDYLESSGDLDNKTQKQVMDIMREMYFSLAMHHSAIKREGIHGAERDMRAVFAASSIGTSHQLSRLKYTGKLNEAMGEVRKEAKKNLSMRSVETEFDKRSELALQQFHSPLTNHLITASFFTHLGMSPAYVFTNMTQVPIITIPWLAARHGSMKASEAVWAAFGDVSKIIKSNWGDQGWDMELKWEGKVTPAEAQMLQDLYARNKLDITMEHDLSAVADQRGTKAGDAIRFVNTPIRITEMANRAVTALAAYRLAMESKDAKKLSKAEAQKFATDQAVKAVDETQLDYSTLNAPRYMNSFMGSKQLARVMFQFRKYQQGMIYLLTKNAYDAVKGGTPQEKEVARRTLAGLFTTTFLFAGAAGLPAAGTIQWLVEALTPEDDDEDWDFAVELRNYFTDLYGPEVAEVLSRGAMTALGVDISKRVGMGDIFSPLPFFKQGKTGQDQVANALLSAGGAPVSMMANIYDGLMKVADGDVMKGMEKIVPIKLAQNMIRAARYNEEGMTDTRGNTILGEERFGFWDKAFRAAGFQTTQESRYYEANAAVQKAEKAAMDRRNRLVTKWARAKMNNDDTADIEAAISEFNDKYRQRGVRIERSSLLKSLQYHKRAAAERNPVGIREDRITKQFAEHGRFGG
jgi:hypothetical protein